MNPQKESPRLWLIDESGNELVQVQRNMFLRNWRCYEDPSVEYPRFKDHILPSFWRDFKLFKDFIENEGLAPLTVEQAEVTYVNRLFPTDPNAGPARLSDFIRYWSSAEGGFGCIEQYDVRFTKLLREDGDPFGRLHVNMSSAWVEDREMMSLNLTARGFKDNIDEFFQVAHREIVTGFDLLTTEAMHTAWEKIHD